MPAASDLAQLTSFIAGLVNLESPSDSPAHIHKFLDHLIKQTADIATATRWRAEGFGDHLLLEFQFTGAREQRALALGHSDTVWPVGTLKAMPFREAEGRLWGPGVLDMKGGLALLIAAARRVVESQLRAKRNLALLVVSDEEVGSPTSRAITEREARKSSHVLVLEPGTGLTGKLKTARKGVGHFHVKITGRASHAGVDFAAGASAIVEAAHFVHRCAGLTDTEIGTTVNPGVITGGTRSNVVAADAALEVDFRVETLREAERVDSSIRSFEPVDPRCTISIEGGLNRPPMERSEGIARLFAQARDLASDIGITLEESSTGGGSDGNFTAAIGIPTLDGLGAVGEGAHATHESVLIDYLPQRLALLTELLSKL